MNNEIKLPIFKCRASKGTVLTTGYKKASFDDLLRIEELKKERDTLVNANGNKVKWTDNKAAELDKLIYLSKNPQLGETCKSYLKEWVIEKITGKSKDVDTYNFQHGIDTEPLALKRAGNYFGCEFEKNTQRIENDYFIGEWDSANKPKDLVIDVKSSISAHTFPYFNETPDEGYYDQLQIYMDLTGLNNAALVHCLENGTDEEIERLAWKIARKESKLLGREEIEMDMTHWNQAKEKLNFDHLPAWMRIRVYDFKRDDNRIEELKARVLDCRPVIENELLPKLLNLKNK
jgi:hypothetical protein